MFAFHTAFSLGMVALAGGAALYVWAIRNHGNGVAFAKIIGLLVITFSIISSLCTVYYGIIYWKEGYFNSPAGMTNTMTSQQKMDQCMTDCKKMSGNIMNMQNMMDHKNNSSHHTH